MDCRVVHILGASGSGTTTMGKLISAEYGYRHLNADDYFWQDTDPPFTVKRDPAERRRLLLWELTRGDRCVLSGSMTGWGDPLIPHLDLVILVETPTPVRLERLRVRESAHFGDRILPGGDMHQNHRDFLAWAALYDDGDLEVRSRALHEQWLSRLPCPVLRMDGAASRLEWSGKLSVYLTAQD